jgi:protein CrcB
MTYLYIGLGGALGSIARAWLGLVVARLTGPQFPWGTILINILGSFVIGFFGTLTATDSRLAVAPDLRAFVMVGICGGFTTFSSFSLQTMELAQDGRVLQAAGNIGLSVALCLLAVTAGHYGALALQPPRVEAQGTAPGGLGAVVAAVLSEPQAAEDLLRASAHLLESGGGGRLKVVAVRMPPAPAVLPSEEVLTAARAQAMRAEREDWAGQLQRMAARWRADAALRQRVRVDWLDVEGDAAQVVVDQGRSADAIVVARPAGHEAERMRACMHAALFDTGCPVLVMPPAGPATFGRNVAIAWKNDTPAREAVRASLPILRQAERVYVLQADAAPAMPAVLADHAVPAQLVTVPDGDGPTGERILAAAHQVGADLLVMGAYAHGAWREALFGGVTRYMLDAADLPLLLRH